MLAAIVTRGVVLDGITSGLTIGLVAVGIVLVYRATRVINFAVGNLGLIGGALLSLTVVQYGVPFWVAVPLSVAAGTAASALAELAVIRRLFRAPRVIVLVATIGLAQLALSVITAYPKVQNAAARFPVAVGASYHLAGLTLSGPQLSTIVVVPVTVALLAWFLARTPLGKAIEAAATNPDLARLSGVSPKMVSTMVWGLGGLLSTISVILIAGQAGTATQLATLGPDTMVRALAAAVIARMVSYRLALLTGLAIGVLEHVVEFNFLNQSGLTDFLILLAVLVAVWFSRSERTTGEEAFHFTTRSQPIPERLKSVWWVRNFNRSGLVVLAGAATLLPIVVNQPSRILLYTTILAYAVCGCSLTVLTGWSGQLSLGQMGFAGIGALLAARLTKGISLNIGWHHTRLIDTAFTGEPFWVAILIAAAVTALVAALIGSMSLRVQGLSLAVTTFAFALACEQYLYNRPILSGGASGTVTFGRGQFLGISMLPERNYYYAVLIILSVIVLAIAWVRRSGVARTTIAVRDNPGAAAAYTVPVTRSRIRAFAMAGFIAGLGGALLAGAVQAVPYTERFYLVNDSLTLVALVVIGGMGSVSGPILGALWVVGLPAFAPHNQLVPLLTSSVGLLALLLYFPKGLVGIGQQVQEAVVRLADRRFAPPGLDIAKRTVAAVRTASRQPSPGGALAASAVTVTYGGIRAVDGVDMVVHDQEIVGLIGANGAGKSTLMNAIGGFVPCSGSVVLLGTELTGKRPEGRAALGLGRTFQTATLFPELTVRETVQVALEARHRSALLPTLLMTPGSLRAERRGRSEAEELLSFLGLGRYADRYIADLSTGTRRIVELAGLLALDARVLCLDEPTAGVAQRETEAFGPLLMEIRRELGAAMLVIEHDMPLIMGISDRVYCLETGRVIASGAPDRVRQDPRVISSYLGTDDRSIMRSASESAPSQR